MCYSKLEEGKHQKDKCYIKSTSIFFIKNQTKYFFLYVFDKPRTDDIKGINSWGGVALYMENNFNQVMEILFVGSSEVNRLEG